MLILQSKAHFERENWYLLSAKDFEPEVAWRMDLTGWGIKSVHGVSDLCLARLTGMCPAQCFLIIHISGAIAVKHSFF